MAPYNAKATKKTTTKKKNTAVAEEVKADAAKVKISEEKPAEEVKKANRQMPIYKAVKDFEVRETELVKTTTKKIKRSANI